MFSFPSNLAIFLFWASISCIPAIASDVSPGSTAPYLSPYYYNNSPNQASPASGDSPSPTPPTDSTSPPTTPGLPDKNKPVDKAEETSNFSFKKTYQRCARSGDIIKFTGHNLAQLSNYTFTILFHSKELLLKPLHITENQLIIQIPEHSGFKSNKSYQISLVDKVNLTRYSPVELTIQLCLLSNENNININYEVGEILIFTDQDQAIIIKQEVETMGFHLIKSDFLKALGKTVLTLKTTENNLNKKIISLRKKFPNATIDVNSHYQQVATKPRIYAPHMISWPQLCKNVSYDSLTIGIIDGLPDLTHPALLNQKITVHNFLKESQQVDMQHGTAIATILLGNQPNMGFTGLLPHINMLAAATLRQEKDKLLATTESIIKALNWLMTNNVRLINISLSGRSDNSVLKHAFSIAIQKRLIIFSAAGNGGETAPPSYPAALPGVIAVTAIDAANRIYRQANQGAYIDFAAPGVDIWVTNQHKQGKYSSGTSYASPHAMAIAAFYLRRNPAISPSLLYAAMKKNTDDLGDSGHDPIFGWGLVRAPEIQCE